MRAVGSSANCAEIMTVMNTIMAFQLRKFKVAVDELIEKGLKKDEAIFNVLRDYIKEVRPILFEGDGYSQEWVEEAEKRGLANLITSPEALATETTTKHINLFQSSAVLSEREIYARNEIKLEKYSANISIEAKVLADLSRNHIIPTGIRYQNELIENVKGLKEIFGEDYRDKAEQQIQLIKKYQNIILKLLVW